jgi:hypothetical protein
VGLVGLRAAALTAALLLAALSRGDVIVLAALLAVGAWRPLPAMAIAASLVATAWRWSSTALEDIAGAQAVLGPAGIVDPPPSAVAAWLGAFAIVLATPDVVAAAGRDAMGRLPRPVPVALSWLPPLAAGATAALVLAGPAPGGSVWVRVVATIAGTALAAWLVRRPAAPEHRQLLERAAAGLGLASLVAVAIDAPGLDEVLDIDALVEGAVLAVAAGTLACAAGAAMVHQQRARGTS